MSYSKVNQTFVDCNKMDLPLKNKIHKNNMNVSIHWVLAHVKNNRKENFSHSSRSIHNFFTIWVVCGKQTHYSPLMS